MKKILLLDGNPKKNSFSASLSAVYEAEAQKQGDIRRFDLSDMIFDPNLKSGYDEVQVLEPCLSDFTQALFWAEHIVIISPIWWGGIPAKLKGLFDRVFLPEVTFKYVSDSIHPVQLLSGKTSRIILTMDTPAEMMEEHAKPLLEQLGRNTLEFCGVHKAKVNLFGSVVLSDDRQKNTWIEIVKELGAGSK